MKTIFRNFSVLAAALSLVVLGSACSNKSKQRGGGAAAEQGPQPVKPGPGKKEQQTPTDEDFTSSYSLMNFRQLAAAYSRATGVPLTGAVLAEFEQQLSSLPTNSDIATLSASQVSAATKLAARFCDELSNNDQLRTQKFGTAIDFGAPIADTMGFAETILDSFFGPVHSLQGERSVDVETVSELAGALAGMTLDDGSNPTTPGIFTGVCAATLASAEYYLL